MHNKSIAYYKFLFSLITLLIYSFCKSQQPVSFIYQILPVLKTHCIQCHYNKGPAPFDFTKPQVIRDNASTIRHVVVKGLMPKWLADDSFTEFYGQNLLSNGEREAIISWVKEGSRVKSFSVSHSHGSDNKPKAYDQLTESITYRLSNNNKDSFNIAKSGFVFSYDTLVRELAYLIENKRFLHHSTLYNISGKVESNKLLVPDKLKSVCTLSDQSGLEN